MLEKRQKDTLQEKSYGAKSYGRGVLGKLKVWIDIANAGDATAAGQSCFGVILVAWLARFAFWFKMTVFFDSLAWSLEVAGIFDCRLPTRFRTVSWP